MAERAPLERLVAGLAVAALAGQLVGLLFGFESMGAATLIDAFFASSLLGAALIAAVALPNRVRVPAIGAGVLLEVALIVSFPPPENFTQWVVERGSGLGLALVGALAVFALRSRDEVRAQALVALRSSLVLPLFVIASGPALQLTIPAHPLTLDGPCLLADQLLGQPSYAAGMLFGRVPPLGQLCAVIYGELPFFCALALVVARRREILSTFIAIGALGYLLYHLFPVVGPRFAFAGWPGRLPLFTEALHHAAAGVAPVPRNCMPSLHTAWVLYCAFHLRGGWRPLGVLWVAGTLLATLGLGFHYGVDLIAAVPFVLAVGWLVKKCA